MKKNRNKLKYSYKTAGRARRKNRKSKLKDRLNIQNPEVEVVTAEEFEVELEKDETKRQQKRLRDERWTRIAARAIQILLAVLSAYTVFLIYGLMVTEYEYDDAGNVRPKIVTVEEIENREIYEVIFRHYLQARILYEDVLRLDYKLSTGEESKLVAMEYEELLDKVSNLTVAIDALSVGTKYGQFKTMLLEWVKTDTAVYLQNMSASILQNDEEKANEALACREQMYNDFLILTENMAVLGESVPGVDLRTLYTWSPEQFISEVLEGVHNE